MQKKSINVWREIFQEGEIRFKFKLQRKEKDIKVNKSTESYR